MAFKSAAPQKTADKYLESSSGGLEIEEQHYCHILNISLETLCQTPLLDSRVINLLEKLLHFLRILDLAPLGFSQKHESQQNIAEKVFYVEECLRITSSFG